MQDPARQPHLFCFGLGFTGARLADCMRAKGWRVSGTARTKKGDDCFAYDAGLAPEPDMIGALQQATHIISTVPPANHTDPICQLIEQNLKHQPWLGYLSTTGIYGNTDGNVVDETASPNPSSERAARRVSAEQAWSDLSKKTQTSLTIFRLPGIYGPGRSVLDQVKAGKSRRVEKQNHVFNRVHVDDIVQAICLALETSSPQQINIYNVCDDLPASPADVTAYACDLLGITPPALIPYEEIKDSMSAMALSFWQDNRQVSNDKIKHALGFSPRYPDYKSGLGAIYADSK